MRAFVLTGPRQFTVAEVEPPVAAPGQVVVDVERAGVCGTDVEFFTGHMAYLHQGHATYPMRLGHEWCGAVSAIVLDGKIHLLGGRDVRSVEWHEVYDPAADKYSDRASMRGSTGTQPFVGQRDHMGVAVVDGKIHAIAGRMDSYDFNTSLNAVYDPKTDGWSFRAPLPTARSGPSCVYINGKIVVFGGEATGKVFGTNEAYDPKTDTWEQLTPMAIPRHGLHGATCAVIGNMVHVPGGGPVPGGQVQGAYHDAFTFG